MIPPSPTYNVSVRDFDFFCRPSYVGLSFVKSFVSYFRQRVKDATSNPGSTPSNAYILADVRQNEKNVRWREYLKANRFANFCCVSTNWLNQPVLNDINKYILYILNGRYTKTLKNEQSTPARTQKVRNLSQLSEFNHVHVIFFFHELFSTFQCFSVYFQIYG